jgi:hypothetical protein
VGGLPFRLWHPSVRHLLRLGDLGGRLLGAEEVTLLYRLVAVLIFNQRNSLGAKVYPLRRHILEWPRHHRHSVDN